MSWVGNGDGGVGPVSAGRRAGRGNRSQVTFSRESSCEHSAPGRRVTSESSVSYINRSPDSLSLPSPCTGLQ